MGVIKRMRKSVEIFEIFFSLLVGMIMIMLATHIACLLACVAPSIALHSSDKGRAEEKDSAGTVSCPYY